MATKLEELVAKHTKYAEEAWWLDDTLRAFGRELLEVAARELEVGGREWRTVDAAAAIRRLAGD